MKYLWLMSMLYRKERTTLFLLLSYSILLLLCRATLTQSIYLFFLVWNTFLGIIPLLISSYIHFTGELLSKTKLIILLLIWLVFLPNSFYIITDVVHLPKSSKHLFWLDATIILSCAITGFYAGFISINQISQVVQLKYAIKIQQWHLVLLAILSGFGIYIGRILRFNSWDIILQPTYLIETLFQQIIDLKPVLFSFHFGLFIYLTLYCFKKITTHEHTF
ncbi:putative membrane protein [Flavobacterium croceum DSM 17960]|uniref:Putative membrane protein n=1 Tax=Flavobacterium croceum DSM 17960 TaxID=1121886 RepID=A0A2S4N7S2_9FLAO|nr:DUF1361 domain-containing protein [Flavobacterium croceum]POS01750.1 putative membrane protein [Flavobacterium croceum DSM 17960]